MTCTPASTALGHRVARPKAGLGAIRSLFARWGERRALAARDEAAKPFWR